METFSSQWVFGTGFISAMLLIVSWLIRVTTPSLQCVGDITAWMWKWRRESHSVGKENWVSSIRNFFPTEGINHSPSIPPANHWPGPVTKWRNGIQRPNDTEYSPDTSRPEPTWQGNGKQQVPWEEGPGHPAGRERSGRAPGRGSHSHQATQVQSGEISRSKQSLAEGSHSIAAGIGMRDFLSAKGSVVFHLLYIKGAAQVLQCH